MANYGIRNKGRQLLKLVYENHKVDEANGALFTMEDILHVELRGDTRAKLNNDWDATATGQSKPL